MDSSPLRCAGCGTEAPAVVLSCPSCGRLFHAATLKKLAASAEAAEQAGDLATALAAWRDTLDLLPPETRQHAAVLQKVQALSARVDEGATPQTPSAWKKGAAGLGGMALLLYKFKAIILIALTKGKFLLMGLTKLPTLLSMLAWIGVYWSLWGWKFAVGMGISIYIHEMGHVWMLRRFGIRATAPMFIPGFGALVRLQQHPATVVEDARIGLAGPFWGLGAAVASFALYHATENPFWGALAQFSAMINLFNMIPVWQLDGGRGFNSLTRGQRWLAVLVIFATYWYTAETAGDHQMRNQNVFLLIIGICGAGRAMLGDAPRQRDDFGLFQFALLIVTLGLLAAVELPVHGR